MKQRFFEVVPSGTSFDFVGKRRRYLLASLGAVLLSFAVMLFNQFTAGSALNFGIDFQGGSQVRIALSHKISVEDMRTTLVDLGYSGGSVVEIPDAENEVMIRVKDVVTISESEEVACEEALGALEGAKLLEDGFDHPPGSSKIFLKFDGQTKNSDLNRLLRAAGCDGQASPGYGKAEEFPVEYALVGIAPKLVEELNQALGAGTVDHIVASETVGAKVGAALKIDGARAMLFSLGFIFLFVMIRFDLRFAPGGIVALAHDTIIVVGIFAVTGKEFNLQTVAALLTIIGYSINDTIVVFDRVRERVALNREDNIDATTNTALNETLSRTVLTSGTTMLVVLSVWLLGSGPIKDFAFALFLGVIVGTYSSLFVASPIFLWVNDRFYRGKGHLMNVLAEEREGTGTLLGAAASAGQGDAPREERGDDEPSTDPTTDDEPPGEKKASRRRRRRSK